MVGSLIPRDVGGRSVRGNAGRERGGFEFAGRLVSIGERQKERVVIARTDRVWRRRPRETVVTREGVPIRDSFKLQSNRPA